MIHQFSSEIVEQYDPPIELCFSRCGAASAPRVEMNDLAEDELVEISPPVIILFNTAIVGLLALFFYEVRTRG